MAGHGQHIHPTWHLVELVTGVVEDRPQPFADEVADIADRLQVTVDRGVPPTNRLDAHVTEFEHVTGRDRVGIQLWHGGARPGLGTADRRGIGIDQVLDVSRVHMVGVTVGHQDDIQISQVVPCLRPVTGVDEDPSSSGFDENT